MGNHFWTTDPNGELLPKPEWHLEGMACKVLPSHYEGENIVPFYRWYNGTIGRHFWTTDPNGELLPKPEWHLEGEACRVFATQSTEGLIPLYRWFNSKRGLHFWTTDPNGELLPKPEWHLEGPACHVFPGDYQNTNAVPFFRFYKSKNNSAQDNGTDWCVTIYSYWNHPTRGPIQNIITRETINANNQAEAHLKAHKAFQKYPSANGYSLSPGAC